jgi:hypothetical protein
MTSSVRFLLLQLFSDGQPSRIDRDCLCPLSVGIVSQDGDAFCGIDLRHNNCIQETKRPLTLVSDPRIQGNRSAATDSRDIIHYSSAFSLLAPHHPPPDSIGERV